LVVTQADRVWAAKPADLTPTHARVADGAV